MAKGQVSSALATAPWVNQPRPLITATVAAATFIRIGLKARCAVGAPGIIEYNVPSGPTYRVTRETIAAIASQPMSAARAPLIATPSNSTVKRASRAAFTASERHNIVPNRSGKR